MALLSRSATGLRTSADREVRGKSRVAFAECSTLRLLNSNTDLKCHRRFCRVSTALQIPDSVRQHSVIADLHCIWRSVTLHNVDDVMFDGEVGSNLSSAVQQDRDEAITTTIQQNDICDYKPNLFTLCLSLINDHFLCTNEIHDGTIVLVITAESSPRHTCGNLECDRLRFSSDL